MKLGVLQKLAQQSADLPAAEAQRLLQEQAFSLGLDPGALYQELEMTSRYVDTHRDVSLDNSQIQLHSHTFYELLCCSNSCGAQYLIGSERYQLIRGDILFIPPGVSHRPVLPEQMSQPYCRYIIWLSPEFFRFCSTQLLDGFAPANPVGLIRTQGTRWEHLESLFLSGVEEAEAKQEGWQAAVFGNTLCLLSQLQRAASSPVTHPLPMEAAGLIDRLTAFVENCHTQPITLAQAARECFVSSSTVSHLCKERLGVSFYRYVTQRRLITAKTLIQRGIALEEVASRSGFGDYSGFYRAFQREFGISPRHYRNLNPHTLP